MSVEGPLNTRIRLPTSEKRISGKVLAVQIGATRIRSALVNADGEVALESLRQVTSLQNNQETRAIFDTTLEHARATYLTADRDVSAVVLIVPSGVDRERGLLHATPRLASIGGYQVVDTFKEFGVPVFLESDANAALMFDYFLGAVNGLETVLGIHLASGIGGALIIDGHLFVGRSGHAAELGHVPVDTSGMRACRCGNTGCLERYASGEALQEAVNRNEGHGIEAVDGNYMDVVYAAEHGNPLASALMSDFAKYLGQGLVGVLNVFNPSAVLFTGSLSRAAPFFLDSVRQITMQRCFADIGYDMDFRVSSDPEFAELRAAPVIAAGIAVRPPDQSPAHTAEPQGKRVSRNEVVLARETSSPRQNRPFEKELAVHLSILYLRAAGNEGWKSITASQLRSRYPFFRRAVDESELLDILRSLSRTTSYTEQTSPDGEFVLDFSDPSFKERTTVAEVAVLGMIDRLREMMLRWLPLADLRNADTSDPVWQLVRSRLIPASSEATLAELAEILRLREGADPSLAEQCLRTLGEIYGWTVEDLSTASDVNLPVAKCTVSIPGLRDSISIAFYTLISEDELEPCAEHAKLNPLPQIAIIFLSDESSPLDRFRVMGRKILRFALSTLVVLGTSRDPKAAFRHALVRQADLELMSPYVSQGVVPEDMFFGRVAELALLRSRQATSFAVYGPRRIGKTSLVRTLGTIVDGDPLRQEASCYLDCAIHSGASDVFADIADSFGLDWSVRGSPADFVIAMRQARDRQPSKRRFLIILDEVDRLFQHSPADIEVFSVLRGLMNERVARVIVVGYRHLCLVSRDLDHPVYNMFQYLFVGNLDATAARDLVTVPLSALGVAFSPSPEAIAKLIVDRASTNPATIQFICHEIVRLLNHSNSRTVTPDHIATIECSSALESFVLGGIQSLGPSEKQVIRMHTAPGPKTLDEIVRSCSGHLDREEVLAAVERLMEYMVLQEAQDSAGRMAYAYVRNRSRVGVLIFWFVRARN